MPEPTPKLVTRTQLAELFGVQPATVQEWAEKGLPCAQRGGKGRASLYGVPDVLAWRLHRELAAHGVTNGNGRLDPNAERAKLDQARREEIEFKLAIRRGEFVRLFDVEHLWSTRIIHARDVLRGWPSQARARLGISAEVARSLGEFIDRALGELAEQFTHEEADDDAPPESDPDPARGRAIHANGAPHPDPLAPALPARVG